MRNRAQTTGLSGARSLLAALALAGSSCGGGGASDLVSCTISAMATPTGSTLKLCEEVSASQRSTLAQTCLLPPDGAAPGIDASTAFTEGPCSHVGALGGCRITNQGILVTDWWYAVGTGSGWTTMDVQEICSHLGTFVAP